MSCPSILRSGARATLSLALPADNNPIYRGYHSALKHLKPIGRLRLPRHSTFCAPHPPAGIHGRHGLTFGLTKGVEDRTIARPPPGTRLSPPTTKEVAGTIRGRNRLTSLRSRMRMVHPLAILGNPRTQWPWRHLLASPDRSRRSARRQPHSGGRRIRLPRWIGLAQARFASDGATSLYSAMRVARSPRAFRRLGAFVDPGPSEAFCELFDGSIRALLRATETTLENSISATC